MKQDWTEKLRERLQEHQTPPPADLWESIERSLPATPPVLQRKPIPLPWYYASAAVLLLLLGVGVYLLSPQLPEVSELTAETQAPSTPSDEQGLIGMSQLAEVLIPTESVPSHRQSRVLQPSNSKPETPGLLPETSVQSEHIESPSSDPSPDPSSESTSQREDVPRLEPINSSPTSTSQSRLRPSRSRGSVWQAGLYASALTTGSSSLSGDLALRVSQEPDCFYLTDDDLMEEPQLYSKSGESSYDYAHRPTKRFGLSLRYRLGGRWSLETGLVYSHLSSDFTYQPNMSMAGVQGEQHLHYLGVPIGVSYNLWQGKSFELYAQMGLGLDIPLSGMRRSQTVIAGSSEPSTVEDLHPRELQWSLYSSIGLQYRLWPRLSLYAEGRLDYYFSNDQDLRTIYQDQPLVLSPQVGLRWSL